VAKISHDLPHGAVIFCHAQVMRAMLWLLLREHEPTKDLMQAFYFFMKAVTIPNAAMVKILIADDRTEVFTGIVSTAHLPPSLQTA
jgi:broad specificity phosphatase PhoE